jgi:creatinine amidohydrolase
MDEVRFDRMVPAEVRARREGCSLAYLPVGSLEWHGPHMPFGTDYLTVTYLAEEGARRFGGVVFPPIYYGDVRFHLQECRAEWRRSYAAEMDVPTEYAAAFGYYPGEADECPLVPDDGAPAEEPLPFSLEEQARFFSQLIAKTLLEIHLYGFRRIVVMPGHGPNPVYCERAIAVYRENVARRQAFGEPAQTVMWFYIDPGRETEPLLRNHWIHADKWEGSITTVAAPGTVHPQHLPPRPALVPAYLGHPYIHEDRGLNPEYEPIRHSIEALDPRNMDEAYGRAQVEALLPRLGEVVAALP